MAAWLAAATRAVVVVVMAAGRNQNRTLTFAFSSSLMTAKIRRKTSMRFASAESLAPGIIIRHEFMLSSSS